MGSAALFAHLMTGNSAAVSTGSTRERAPSRSNASGASDCHCEARNCGTLTSHTPRSARAASNGAALRFAPEGGFETSITPRLAPRVEARSAKRYAGVPQ